MHIPSFQELRLKRYDRERYYFEKKYKLWAAMFFWYYSILCLGGLDCELERRDGKKFRKKYDTKIILALWLVRLTREKNNIIKQKFETKKPISYKDLIIVWWLVFDKKSKRNEQLREIFADTGYEYILDNKVHDFYSYFFEKKSYRIGKNGKENNFDDIDKISFKKYLVYIPKDLLIYSMLLIFKCSDEKIHNDLRKNNILWYERSTISYYFSSSFVEFMAIPRTVEEKSQIHRYTTKDRESYYRINRQEIRKKLKWKPNDKLKAYNRMFRPSSENWIHAIEKVLQRAEEIEKQKDNKKLS